MTEDLENQDGGSSADEVDSGTATHADESDESDESGALQAAGDEVIHDGEPDDAARTEPSDDQEAERGAREIEPPEDPSAAAVYELRKLEALLRRARNAWRNPLMVEGALWSVTTAFAVLASALLFGLLFPDWAHPGADLILLIGGVATLIGTLSVALPFWLSAPDLEEAAAHLQRYNADLRSDVVGALQFARQLADSELHGFSETLALEHVRRTVRKLHQMDKAEGGLAASLPHRPIQAPALALAATIALVMVPWLVVPERVGEILDLQLLTSETSADEDEEKRPVVGDLDLYFSFPSYTERTSEFQAFTTGNIETLVGTEVTIKTYPLVKAARYEVVMELAEGDERRRELEPTDDGRLEATMLVTKPGTYHFEATMADGTRLSDGIDRRITVRPDEAPAVKITSHETKIEVSPDEVIEFDFTVTDDFGIESVGFVHHFAGQSEQASKVPVDLPELANTPDEVEGTFTFELGPLNLQPKDVVVLRLEATDNNSLTGPGVGKSAEFMLRVASPEDKHMEVIRAQQEVLEQLLLVLADYLESPMGTRVPDSDNIYQQKVPANVDAAQIQTRVSRLTGAHQAHGTALEEMNRVLKRMKDDPLMLPRDEAIFEALYDQLYDLHRDGDDLLNRLGPRAANGELGRTGLQKLADYAADSENALEKGLLRLEDLLASQKMEAIESAAEEVREMKERLKELLEKYRDTKDPELKKAILREIQRLRQRMAELLQRMQDDMKKLKQDHVNMEAIEQQMMESDAAKMSENLQSIEDLLDQGDIDGALDALDQMTANLDSLTQEMDSEFAQAQPEGLNELDKKLSELMDEVNDVEQMQRDVEQKTNELREKEQRERRAKMEETIDRLTREARELVEEQKRDLAEIDRSKMPEHEREGLERAERRLEKLDEMLQQRDLESAGDAARGSIDDLRSLQFGMELAQRYSKSKAENAEMKDAVESLNDEMNPRAREIVDELEEAMNQAQRQLSQNDSQEMKQLEQRQQQVEQRAQQLRQKIDEASQEFPMIGNQLEPNMDGAQKKMKEASDSLGEGRTQRALDQERGALDQLNQLKESMKQALQKQQQRQPREQNRDKIEIPDGPSGKTNDDFRESVKEGMKGERLEDYASEIERYYESLTE